jgi:hypothetical protein
MREHLLSIGDTVTSRWLDFRKMPSWSFGIAREDCEDLMAADVVIIFTEIPNMVLATGDLKCDPDESRMAVLQLYR